ncbi:MAG: nitroreductase family protein [Candidatus Omnitrophota bacterium]|jgi:nitroreductase|nr:MAG: nitroreductase family protein [Candidatus Omnitrophota bacterium]
MNVLALIKSRRSIRKYKKQIPSDRIIHSVLEAGRWAPSGLNNQPWRFFVVKDNAAKNKLASFTKYSRVIKEAPLIIVICLNLKDSYHREKDLMAIGAYIQNMLLQAHASGLGACWLGEILNKKEEVAHGLCLPKGFELVAVVSLGYPDEFIKAGKRRPLKGSIIPEKS